MTLPKDPIPITARSWKSATPTCSPVRLKSTGSFHPSGSSLDTSVSEEEVGPVEEEAETRSSLLAALGVDTSTLLSVLDLELELAPFFPAFLCFDCENPIFCETKRNQKKKKSIENKEGKGLEYYDTVVLFPSRPSSAFFSHKGTEWVFQKKSMSFFSLNIGK